MGDLPLTKQDAEMLVKALDALLQHVAGRADLPPLQASIQSLIARIQLLHDEERQQAIVALQVELSRIAAELESGHSEAEN